MSEMITEEEIKSKFELKLSDLKIDTSSIFALEKEIKRYSELVDNYSRAYAYVLKLEAQAKLGLDITQAEIITEYTENDKNLTASKVQEIRKSLIFKHERYKNAANKLIELTELVNIYKGLYFAIVYKNERIKELFQMEMRKLIGGGQRGITSKQLDSMLNTELENYKEE